MNPINILLIFALVALSAFFVAVEYAVIAGKRVRLDMLVKDETKLTRIVKEWLEVPAKRDKLIATNQLAITMIGLALGAVGENAFVAWLDPYFEMLTLPPWLQFLKNIIPALPLIISLIVITFPQIILGEMVPKVAVLHWPEKYLLLAAPFMHLFMQTFQWFSNLLDWLTQSVLRLLGLPSSSGHTLLYSTEEIKQIITGPETKGVIHDSERDMLSAVLDFGGMVVRQVLVPRMDIIAVPADMPLQEVTMVASKNLVTKLPVYEDSLEQIIGIVHILDILCRPREDENGVLLTARDIAREALFVPETISVNDLLLHFRTRRTHMAIVMDEFGGTAGLVTLETLLQEIVGEVQDVFDTNTEEIQALADGSVRLGGMALIEEVNETLGLNLDDPNYDTIAGYLLGKLGYIPKLGEVLVDRENGISLKVEDMDKLRIAQILLRRI